MVFVIYREVALKSIKFDKKGDVTVCVPIGTKREEVKDYIRSHKDWIELNYCKKISIPKTKKDFFSEDAPSKDSDYYNLLMKFSLRLSQLFVQSAISFGARPPQLDFELSPESLIRFDKEANQMIVTPYFMALPDRCAEYLIVEKLVDAIVEDNGGNKTKLMNQHCPNWRTIRRDLKEICKTIPLDI